jgi:Flp pilus assembly protein TadD
MRPIRSLLLGLMLAPTTIARAARDDAGEPGTPPDAIERLITDLGSDKYAVRRRAEEQLLQMGPEALDALSAAEDNDDLEIADRVQYIMQRMRVEWNRPDDTPDVRRLLTRYGDLSEEGRGERITQLAALADGGGLAALCRIARFDASPLVARRAAMAMLKLELDADARKAAAPACLKELSGSERPPAVWMELYLRELDEPVAAIADWAKATAAEAKLLADESGDTDFVTVYDLLGRHLERCHELKLGDETTAALVAIVGITDDPEQAGQLEAGLAWSVRWIIKHQRWDVLEPLEDRYEKTFRHSRKLLYYLAAASAKGGRDERAATLAQRAFTLPDNEDPLGDDRVAIAEAVADLGQVAWAEREYRRAIEEFPVIDQRSMEARNNLAMWLHDREDYQGAADLLGEFCDALDEDRPARTRLIESINEENASGRETLSSVEARRRFYQACVAESKRDYDSQRELLEQAAAAYEKDPDILIAMYRSPVSDDAFRRRTATRIRRAGQYMQGLIDEYPEYPGYYNQWAWLIANTEGDQKKAVEYSKRSLELAPDEPSYLDTLGRCYYAVGDFQNAVKSQQKAVELAPHYEIMRRQLAIFEKALASQQVGGAPKAED